MVDMGSLSAILSNPVFMWIKVIVYTAVGGAVVYAIYSYLQYNVEVEYNQLMGNGVIKEVKRKAKRWNDRGSVKYRIWRSKIILQRPKDYSFITLRGKKEKIRLLAVGDNQHFFLKLNPEMMFYEATPADVEEWSVLTHEYYFKKYMEMKDKLGRILPWIGIGLGAVVFIIAMWFAVDIMTSTSSHISGVADKLDSAIDKFTAKPSTIPAENLPN